MFHPCYGNLVSANLLRTMLMHTWKPALSFVMTVMTVALSSSVHLWDSGANVPVREYDGSLVEKEHSIATPRS